MKHAYRPGKTWEKRKLGVKWLAPCILILLAVSAYGAEEPPRAFIPSVWENFPKEADLSEMVYVAAGSFMMGCDSTISDKCDADEKPMRQVTLGSYWIDRYEVTNQDYAECVKAGGCTAPLHNSSYTRSSYYDDVKYADYPVMWVNWQQAVNYCRWEGKRLPTEAEWEKAARGADSRLYPWGNAAPDCTLLNFFDSANYCVGDTTRVEKYPGGASPYGAINMSGNVMEWVSDWYQKEYYQNADDTNPQGPESGEERVLRGGCWYTNRWFARTTSRDRAAPDQSFACDGFRCAYSE